MSDRPCAACALGQETVSPPPGIYSTEQISIVASPRHGEPQDWLNVHSEMSLPAESRDVWSQADCRSAGEIQSDPARWESSGDCVECSMSSYGYAGRPHKWCRTTLFIREKQNQPLDAGRPEPVMFNAQELLSRLGQAPQTIPGITVMHGDSDCLAYWQIRPARLH